MIALAPVTLTGSPQTVQLAAGAPTGQVDPIRVANESPYALQVQLGGDIHWVNPWTADVFTPAQRITSIGIVPQQLVSPVPPAPTKSLVITLAETGEQFAGGYPMNLDRQSAVFNTANSLGRVSDSTGAGTGKSLTLPAGAVALALMPNSLPPNAGTTPVQVQVVGDTTGDIYLNANGNVFLSPLFCAVVQTADATVTVFVVGHAGRTDYVDVFALTTPQVVSMVIAGVGNTAITEAGQDPGTGTQSIPVVPPANYAGTPWQVPNRPPVDISTGSIAVGATVVLVAAVANKANLLLWVKLTAAAGADAFQLQDTNGTPIADGRTDQATASDGINAPFFGVQLATGAGLQVKNLAGVGTPYVGFILRSLV